MVVLPDPPLEPLPDDDPPEPGYIKPLPPPVLPLSPSVPIGLLPVPEPPPDEPGAGDVDSLLPLLPPAPSGQGQLHMPPAPVAPADTPVPPPVRAPEPELPEPPEAPTPPAPPTPPGVTSEVGAPSAPPVMLLPRVASDCAQLKGQLANNNADTSALA